MSVSRAQMNWYGFRDACVSVVETSPVIPSYSHKGLLVFLHGRLGSSEIWLPLIKELSLQFRCLVVDFPGFGKSFTREDKAFSLLENVSLSQEIISKYSAEKEKLILIGHDTGGSIAQLCALKLPQKITGLVLINSALLSRELEKIKTGIQGWAARYYLRRLMRGSDQLPLDAREGLIRPWGQSFSRNALLQALRALDDTWPWHYERQTWKKKVEQIQQPVLLLWGKKDLLSPVERAHELFRLLPDAYLFIHEHSGHWPSLESPDWVLQKLKEFIFRAEAEEPSFIAQKSLSR